MAGFLSDQDIECALLWRLSRDHGWSSEVEVHQLASDANVSDEKRARDIARNQLAGRPYIGFHQGRDEIWLQGPPSDDVCYDLRDICGYHPLQIEATFDSYFDGF